MERPGDQEALGKLGRLEDRSKEDGGGWGRGDTERGRGMLGQEMEARVQAVKGPCAVGHSPTLLCVSQDVRSGGSEELKKWAGDVRGWGNRKRKKVRVDHLREVGEWSVRAGVGEQEAEEVVDRRLVG